MNIHILGISGTFMASLAILAGEAGYKVTGSDANCYPPISDILKSKGIRWTEGYDDCSDMLKADLVLLAMGFVSPIAEGMLAEAEVKLDPRGNVAADMVAYKSSVEKIFACGDMRRGQSLVVWAIREGRQCAASVDAYLMGSTVLPI